jgi:DNA-directed RNA polymerase specialized sigma24 family protein
MSHPHEEAFFELARRTALRQAIRFGLDRDTAEECAQSFVVRWLFRALDPPPWTWSAARCRPYVARAARNYVADYAIEAERSRLEAISVHCEFQERCPPHADASPAVRLLRHAFWDEIQVGIDRLAPPVKTLFVRRHLENWSVEDLAVATGRTANAVSHSLRNSCGRMRQLLAARGTTAGELHACATAAPLAPPAVPRSRPVPIEEIEPW